MNTAGDILLAIDIGNTNVTIGAFAGEELRESWRISTDRHRKADEYRPLLAGLLLTAGLDYGGLRGAILASVVPPVLAEMTEALEKAGVATTALTAGLNVGLPVSYDPPSSVGADRLANGIAAGELYGTPAIIVDLGTATTIEVIDKAGAYIGGSISPGLESSMEALFAGAFQLPRLQLIAPPRAIGTTTVDSIRSGAVFGWASMVDGLVDRFLAEIEGEPVIIGTGGLAPLVAPHSRLITVVDVDLTLHGLRIAFERLARGAARPS
jgi:type III pantothenate kinase